MGTRGLSDPFLQTQTDDMDVTTTEDAKQLLIEGRLGRDFCSCPDDFR